MKKCISLFFLALLSGSTALARCVYTTTKDGNFSDPSIYTGGCTTAPAAGSTIIINNKVVMNQIFTSTGAITIGAAGSLVQDATNRTLTMNGGHAHDCGHHRPGAAAAVGSRAEFYEDYGQCGGQLHDSGELHALYGQPDDD